MPKSKATYATQPSLTNVKTAFAVQFEGLSAPFGVHHPCMRNPYQVCVANVDEIWMNHLVCKRSYQPVSGSHHF